MELFCQETTLAEQKLSMQFGIITSNWGNLETIEKLDAKTPVYKFVSENSGRATKSTRE